MTRFSSYPDGLWVLILTRAALVRHIGLEGTFKGKWEFLAFGDAMGLTEDCGR